MRAKKIGRRWSLSRKDAVKCAVAEISMHNLLHFAGVPAHIINRVKLIKVGDDICLDERALNEIDPLRFMEIRARMGNALGISP